MKLSPLHLASLERLQIYRTHAPALGERLRLLARFMVGLLVIVILVGVLFTWLDVPGALAIVLGIYLGAMAREIGHQRQFVQWWPLTRHITDWDKVDQLVREGSEVPAVTTPEPPPKTNWKRAVLAGVVGFGVIFGLAVAWDRTIAFVHNPTRNNPNHGVIILTTSWCGYCQSLREHLADLNVPYTELNVEKTTEGGLAYSAVRGTGVPITIVGDQVIRGIGTQEVRWGRIDDALRKAGYADTDARMPSGPQREGEWESSPFER